MRTVRTIIDFLPREADGECFQAALLVTPTHRHIFMTWEPQVVEISLDQDRRDTSSRGGLPQEKHSIKILLFPSDREFCTTWIDHVN